MTRVRFSQAAPIRRSCVAGAHVALKKRRMLFDSAGRHHGAIAQLGERLFCKQDVVGSIPSGSTTYSQVAQLVERPAVNRMVVGSSPTLGATSRRHRLAAKDTGLSRRKSRVRIPLAIPLPHVAQRMSTALRKRTDVGSNPIVGSIQQGVGESGVPACLGSRRSLVQIQPP
jgi:hypothetical protein